MSYGVFEKKECSEDCKISRFLRGVGKTRPLLTQDSNRRRWRALVTKKYVWKTLAWRMTAFSSTQPSFFRPGHFRSGDFVKGWGKKGGQVDQNIILPLYHYDLYTWIEHTHSLPFLALHTLIWRSKFLFVYCFTTCFQETSAWRIQQFADASFPHILPISNFVPTCVGVDFSMEVVSIYHWTPLVVFNCWRIELLVPFAQVQKH